MATDHVSRASSPSLTAREARRVFLICHGLRWLPTGLVLPIMVLLLIERGLDLAQIGFVFALYGAVTAILELPTGGLADAIGHKPVLLAATLFEAALVGGLLLGQNLWHFLVATALGAIGRALLSGPLESWYVDTARAADPRIVLRPALAAAGVVEAFALAGGAILCGLLPLLASGLPLDGLVSLLSLPLMAALAAQAASFAAVLLLVVETKRSTRGETPMLGDVPGIVAGGLRLAAGTHDLRLILSSTFLAVTAMITVEILWQPRFADLLGGVETATKVNGFLVAALSLAAAAGSWSANRLPGSLAQHAPRAAAVAALASAAALAALAAATTFALAALAFFLLYATTAAHSVVRSELLHDRVPSAHRATMVSTLSISQQAGNLVSSLTLARLADVIGIPFVWAIGAGLFVLQAALVSLVRPLDPHQLLRPPGYGPPRASEPCDGWLDEASTESGRDAGPAH
jgi:MFS family permease